MIEKVDVKSLNLKELEEFLLSLGEKEIPGQSRYMNGCTSIMSPPLMK